MKRSATFRVDTIILDQFKDFTNDGRTMTWHVEQALTGYMSIEPKKEVKRVKVPDVKESFSASGFTDLQIVEIKRVRKLNKGGALTERVANAIGKEFYQASQMGYSFDDLITEWEVRGWKSFKSEWLSNSKGGNNGGSKKSLAQRTEEGTDLLLAQIEAEESAARLLESNDQPLWPPVG